ncbi:hypothetical protein DY000_02058682 [Brassica cretica]|uniref:WRKY domain-containing protein n=1 Tax=Brassica cretica TaxID=69181 RepID=A0ABQ7B046_BRACR|nr:hypothetical protein DY000_02058682 [Brassica cretica]
MSSHRCYTKSNQMSSGFVFTNHLSQVSGSRGKPLFSSVSVKRICYIDPIGRFKQSYCFIIGHLKKHEIESEKSDQGSCRKQKDAYIPTNEYSWRKYCQKPIKGSPHPRLVFRIRF